MSLRDEFRKLTHPHDDEDEDYMDDYYDEAPEEDEPVEDAPRINLFSGFGSAAAAEDETAEEDAEPQTPAPVFRYLRSREAREHKESKVVNLNSASGSASQLVIIKPERLEVAKDITDHLRNQRTVVINLDTTPADISRRLVDVLSGASYALNATVTKITNKVIVIVPSGVSMLGDLNGQLESLGMYF